MNKSLLFVVLLAVCTLVAASPRKDDRKRQGRARKRGGMPFLNDPKLCWPTMKNASKLSCCAAPELFSETDLSTCAASFSPLRFGLAPKGVKLENKARFKIGRNSRKQRDVSIEKGEKSNGQSREEGKGPGGPPGGMRWMIKKACTLDCYFNSNSFYTTTGGIDGDKVLAKLVANPSVTAEWNPIVTAAVKECVTGADGFDTSKMPPPPPGQTKCNFKAMAFNGCLKRYLTVNCAASATTTSASCTEVIDKLKQCDPFYVPARFGPPPNAQGANAQKDKVQPDNMRLTVPSGDSSKAGGANAQKEKVQPAGNMKLAVTTGGK